MLSINAIAVASIFSAHASMLPEQSQTHVNRKKVASISTAIMITISIIALFIPLIIQSILPDPENVKWWEPSGKLVLFYIPIVATGFALFGLVTMIITFFSVDESFYDKTVSIRREKKSIGATFKQMKVPVKNKKYRKVLSVGFFNSIAGRILGILVIPFLAFVLQFKGPQFFIYVSISVSCKFGWYFLFKKIFKKKTLIASYSILLIISVFAALLELLFLITILSFELKIALFIITIGTILGTIYAANLFTSPLISAIIYETVQNKDQNIQEKQITKISGSYFGAYSFILMLGEASASILMGLILTGGNQNNSTIIIISLSLMGICYLISFSFLRKIELKEELLEYIS
jgi:Na+/melibiose symporter-like transporter